jgi:hypothetical protein
MIDSFISDIWSQLVTLLPAIAGAIIVLIVGWAAGRLIGKGIATVLDKAGVDDALRKTAIGKVLEKTKLKIVGVFDLIIRWFIYLIAILAAVDILHITILSTYLSQVVQYLPLFIAGIFILILGFMAADFAADALREVGKEGKMEFASVFANVLRFVLYFVVLVVGLSTMKVDVNILYILANALSWGVAIGIAVGFGIAVGWGFKDAVAKRADAWLDAAGEMAKKAREKP